MTIADALMVIETAMKMDSNAHLVGLAYSPDSDNPEIALYGRSDEIGGFVVTYNSLEGLAVYQNSGKLAPMLFVSRGEK